MNYLKKLALDILDAAINSVKPELLIPNFVELNENILRVQNSEFDLNKFKNIYVLGIGKASASMARELEKILKEKISGGVVITKYNHSLKCDRIKIIEAGHPVTDQNGITASQKVIEIAEEAGADDFVLFLISGGGSALFEKLPEEISLSDWQLLNELLLKCGADIREINQIRKSISQVKGGKFAKHLYPATIAALYISDIPNNDLSLIASGPILNSESNLKNIEWILNKYNLKNKLPHSIIDYLSNLNPNEENSKWVDPCYFENVNNFLLGTNDYAVSKAAEKSRSFGFETEMLFGFLEGGAAEAGVKIADLAKSTIIKNSPSARCFIFGGETTVEVRGNGLGGRNQELVLSALIELRNYSKKFFLLSCGTDGTDGPTDAAGAFIENGSFAKVDAEKANPQEYLKNNDSYHFFERIDQLIKTGATGTNVMDIAILLIEENFNFS